MKHSKFSFRRPALWMMAFLTTFAFGITACDSDDPDEVLEPEPSVTPTPDSTPTANPIHCSSYVQLESAYPWLTKSDNFYYLIKSLTLSDKAISIQSVRMYVDGELRDEKPYSPNVRLQTGVYDLSHGEHTIELSAQLQKDGYDDTEYFFGQDSDIIRVVDVLPHLKLSAQLVRLLCSKLDIGDQSFSKEDWDNMDVFNDSRNKRFYANDKEVFPNFWDEFPVPQDGDGDAENQIISESGKKAPWTYFWFYQNYDADGNLIVSYRRDDYVTRPIIDASVTNYEAKIKNYYVYWDGQIKLPTEFYTNLTNNTYLFLKRLIQPHDIEVVIRADIEGTHEGLPITSSSSFTFKLECYE